jgi:Transketolase, thiamine diphosphate binding domain
MMLHNDVKHFKLIYLYDDNHVTLSAGTDLTFTEDRARRFEAYGWHIQSVVDGNDLASIDSALRAARGEAERPSLILVRTHIGFGSPHKQDSFDRYSPDSGSLVAMVAPSGVLGNGKSCTASAAGGRNRQLTAPRR